MVSIEFLGTVKVLSLPVHPSGRTRPHSWGGVKLYVPADAPLIEWMP
jgi:hypothetical protein